LSKAKAASKAVEDLLKAAEKIDFFSPAFPTIAYHKARILIEQDKKTEAAKLLDEILGSNLDLPVSTRNEFAELRMKIAETLETFLRNATRKPFTFADYEESVSIAEVIARQKAWWSKDFDQSKDEWENSTEEQFAGYKKWEKREMFDEPTVRIINEHFPLAVLLEAQKSPGLPEYLRERLAIVIWTRAAILENDAVLQRIAPEIIKIAPEAENYLKAKTTLARRFAALYVIFRNENFVPFVQSGFNQGYATFETASGWWCAVSDYDYEGGKEMPRKIPPRPVFLTAGQSIAAQAEKKKITEAGSAPEFLSIKAKEWLKIAPKDKRLPEILYKASEANEPFQYGCGNLTGKVELMNLLQKNFPDSEWTKKLDP
jgi:hypothetical protein